MHKKAFQVPAGNTLTGVGKAREDMLACELIQTSLCSNKATSQWVRDCRAATRFVLTWLTVAIALGVGVYLAATSDDARPYFVTIASFATTAFGWWFARRSHNPLDAEGKV